MNSISLFSCEIINYSAEKKEGVILSENAYGKYVKFRLKESRYKLPNFWLCIVNDPSLVKKIGNMKLVIGDMVNVIGSIESYSDKEQKRTSYRIVVNEIDYAVKKMSGQNPSKEADKEQKAEERNTPPTPSIDLDDQNLFVKRVEYE